MNNKGFTLVELLSVIIILTLIMFLVLPNITNMVKNKETEIDELTFNIIKDATKLYIEDNNKLYKKINGNKYCISLIELVESGYLKENIKFDGDDIINLKTMQVTYENGFIYELVYSNSCQMTVPTYQNGSVVYFDVKKGYGCTEEEYQKSYDASILDYLNSKTGYNGIDNKIVNQNSCLKFYAFNDNGREDVNLILDHNTTAAVEWISKKDYTSLGGTEEEYGEKGNNSKGPITLIKQLNTDTMNWQGTNNLENYIVKQQNSGNYIIDYNKHTARIITANEIAKITNHTSFNESTNTNGIYLDTNNSMQKDTCKEGNVSGCNYGWLYDRTLPTCKNYGCLNNEIVNGSTTYGYWISTSLPNYSFSAWVLNFNSNMTNQGVANNNRGIRPVIEVSKLRLITE